MAFVPFTDTWESFNWSGPTQQLAVATSKQVKIYDLQFRAGDHTGWNQFNEVDLVTVLLAPSGALVVIMVYYIYINPVFQIFQILQILKWKWKWKWKDQTCAIFLKSMGFKDIEYDIPVYQM